jgi:hypothetical protein
LTKPDTNTGFPEVPEGYFWEVKYASSHGWLRLYLKKKTWIFSETVDWTIVKPPFSPENFYQDGLYLLGKVERAKAALALEEATDKYIGKYPPKSLKEIDA